ncbi:MAG: hypothetical protein VKO21_08970 [Candidatus Sericytochromatia bacterium]|nr:hypothetical protein [Candidatus Sericytochromatia bacterium]
MPAPLDSPARPTTRPPSAVTRTPETPAALLERTRKQLDRTPPEVPTAPAARKAWVAQETAILKGVSTDMKALREAWFEGQVDFDTYTTLSSRLFDRQVKLDRATAAGAAERPSRPGECPDYLSPGLLSFIERNPDNGLGLVGATVLPAAALVDLVTVLSRLSDACRPVPPGR